MVKIAAPLIFGLFTCFVFADKLHLRDGRVLSGAVERQRDTYYLTDDDGEKFSFHKDEVLRVIYESRVTLNELAIMLSEFEELIAPAFGLVEPKQLRTDPWSSRTGSGGRSNKPRQTDEDPLTKERLVLRHSTSEFIARWKSYAPKFEAVSRTMTYQNQITLKRGQRSLIEFARMPPEGAEVLAESLKSYLDLVKDTFEDAERADRISIAMRETELRYNRQIRHAKFRFPSTWEGQRQADQEVRRLRAMKESELQRMRISSENLINRIATSRVVGVQLLDEVWSLLRATMDEGALALSQTIASSDEGESK